MVREFDRSKPARSQGHNEAGHVKVRSSINGDVVMSEVCRGCEDGSSYCLGRRDKFPVSICWSAWIAQYFGRSDRSCRSGPGVRRESSPVYWLSVDTTGMLAEVR